MMIENSGIRMNIFVSQAEISSKPLTQLNNLLHFFIFYCLVTVHLGRILINNKPDAQFLLYVFISILYMFRAPIPVAARSQAQVSGRSPAEIVGSYPTRDMVICLL
jgi:hypothetical protein